jgi:hypothetical protein
MPNQLIIKIESDYFMTSFKVDQDYSNPWMQDTIDELMDEFNEGSPPAAIAIVDAAVMGAAREDLGKIFITGAAGGSDFDIIQKSALTTETAIPPEGLTLGDLADEDYVVCYV